MEQNFNPEILYAKFGFDLDDSRSSQTFVSFSGAFRRGHVTPEEMTKVLAMLTQAESNAETGILVFDLSAMTYWDTMGINSVIPLIAKINGRWTKRSGIYGPKDTQPFKDANARHRPTFAAGKILWEPTKDELLQNLERRS